MNVLVMPATYAAYDELKDSPAGQAAIKACPACRRGDKAGPRHWPGMRCGGTNAPGHRIDSHCTCDACF